MTVSIITSHLDYLTRSYHATLEQKDLFPAIPGFKVKKKLGKTRQYAQGYELECGGFLLLGEDEKQGSLLEISGEPLLELRNKYNYTDEYLLIHTSNTPKFRHTTRMDYCWNIPTPGVNVLDTLKHWNEEKVVTRITAKPRIYAENDKEKGGVSGKGTTIYYGAKESDVQVRVYDKGAEMKLLNESLLRVELQVRGEVAPILSVDAAKKGVKVVMQTKLRRVLDFYGLEWWQKMYAEDVVELSPYKRKPASAMKFLQKTVDPFIMANVEDRDFAQLLTQLITKWAGVAYETLESEE